MGGATNQPAFRLVRIRDDALLGVPALLATTVYLAGLAASMLIRHPGPWVLGAWAAPVAYEAASLWLVDSAVIC
jgi:hypothetical protein